MYIMSEMVDDEVFLIIIEFNGKNVHVNDHLGSKTCILICLVLNDKLNYCLISHMLPHTLKRAPTCIKVILRINCSTDKNISSIECKHASHGVLP